MTRTRKPKSARAAVIQKGAAYNEEQDRKEALEGMTPDIAERIIETDTTGASEDPFDEDAAEKEDRSIMGDLSKLSDINEEIKEQIESKFAKLFAYYAQRFRFGRFPDWQFKGWQFIFHFGSLADRDMPHILLLGWKTIFFGAFKVKELPPEGQEIRGENIKGTIVQGQIWFPFDRFGKL